jgi:hypothetical protein
MRYFLGTLLTFLKAQRLVGWWGFSAQVKFPSYFPFTNEHELFFIRNKIKRRNKTIKPVSDKDLG